jgi:hypothetical protein
MVSAKSHFYFAVQEDNPIISSRSPTLDVIEAVPIETQPLMNTDDDHRSRPPTPDPIQTQVHTETTEPWRSCPPTPDTTTNVDEQQEGIRSSFSHFTNSSLSASLIIFAIFMTIDALLIYTLCFPLFFCT